MPRPFGVGFQLLAQLTDEDPQRLHVAAVLAAPHLLQEVAGRQDLAALAEDRCRLVGDGRFVDRGHTLDDLTTAGDKMSPSTGTTCPACRSLARTGSTIAESLSGWSSTLATVSDRIVAAAERIHIVDTVGAGVTTR